MALVPLAQILVRALLSREDIKAAHKTCRVGRRFEVCFIVVTAPTNLFWRKRVNSQELRFIVIGRFSPERVAAEFSSGKTVE
jgi:hypothetical protein